MAGMKPISLEQIIQIAEFRSRLRAFLRHNEQVARRFGLTPQRYELLLAIKGAPAGSQRLSFTELAQRIHLSRNTVTELCARAEEAGLIMRSPSREDHRVVYLRLTRKGENLLRKALTENERSRHELMDAFQNLRESFASV
jgi:DNA-binding MarR family transcriptional regulator